MQNWNEGKTQEYKNRTNYDIHGSKLKHGVSHIKPESRCNAEEQKAAASKGEVKADTGLFLFTTKTCPNCKAAREFLKGMNYRVIDAEEHPELAEKFNIFQAPTLVVDFENDGIVLKFAGASNIRKFVEQNKEILRVSV